MLVYIEYSSDGWHFYHFNYGYLATTEPLGNVVINRIHLVTELHVVNNSKATSNPKYGKFYQKFSPIHSLWCSYILVTI